MKEYIKFGFGAYIGYEAAKKTIKIAKEIYDILKIRIKEGSC